MMKRIAEWIGLTKAERNIIIFLAAIMLIGAGIRLYQEIFPSKQPFDYRVSDSTFAKLSIGADENVDIAGAAVHGKEAGKLNVNTATKLQLMDLPGIGEVTAERILKYRKDNGKFNTIEDLREIKGVSQKKLERLKPMITAQ